VSEYYSEQRPTSAMALCQLTDGPWSDMLQHLPLVMIGCADPTHSRHRQWCSQDQNHAYDHKRD